MFYTETQKYTQKWLWAILIFLLISTFSPLFRAMLAGAGSAVVTAFPVSMVINLIFTAGVFAFFLFAKMDTLIDKEGIHISHPIKDRSVTWEEVDYLEPITYTGFLVGWGLRYTPEYGFVYNIKGNQGILVHLTDGKKFMFGTQHPDKIILGMQEAKKDKLKA